MMRVFTGPEDAPSLDERFERLVEEHQTSLLRTCYLYLGDAALAEDAVQETFLKAYRALPGFRGESSEKTWLMRIAINVCRDQLRKGWFRHVDRRVTPEMLPEATAPAEAGDDALLAEVMNLPAKEREVVLLYYYQDMDTRTIARILHIARSSVSGRLRSARARLRAVLEGRDLP